MRREWGGFGAILSEAEALDETLRETPRLACPRCGTPLDVNGEGAVNCPMGHYRRSSRPMLSEDADGSQ
jgi:hypothetical protein